MTHLLLALTLTLYPSMASAKAEIYKVDTSTSKVIWEGSKIIGKHQGELKIKTGSLTVEKGALKSGTIEIDMATLTNKDITDPGSNAKLVGHLKSDDFFSAEKHPTARLEITKVEDKAGKATVTGNLTIKGITKPIQFPANFKTEGRALKASGRVTVDRTLYDIKYRSSKFFSDIGDKVIHDTFTVDFDLISRK